MRLDIEEGAGPQIGDVVCQHPRLAAVEAETGRRAGQSGPGRQGEGVQRHRAALAGLQNIQREGLAGPVFQQDVIDFGIGQEGIGKLGRFRRDIARQPGQPDRVGLALQRQDPVTGGQPASRGSRRDDDFSLRNEEGERKDRAVCLCMRGPDRVETVDPRVRVPGQRG